MIDKLISNATPLIYLAKADQLEIFQTVIRQILIPQSVYREVVVEGKNLVLRLISFVPDSGKITVEI